MANWVRVADAGDVSDGEVTAYSVGDRQVAVANLGSELRAFDDKCTHQGCSLAEGELDETTIECPCHGSQFDITTGEAVQGPAVDAVDVFEVRDQDGQLQVLVEAE